MLDKSCFPDRLVVMLFFGQSALNSTISEKNGPVTRVISDIFWIIDFSPETVLASQRVRA